MQDLLKQAGIRAGGAAQAILNEPVLNERQRRQGLARVPEQLFQVLCMVLRAGNRVNTGQMLVSWTFYWMGDRALNVLIREVWMALNCTEQSLTQVWLFGRLPGGGDFKDHGGKSQTWEFILCPRNTTEEF